MNTTLAPQNGSIAASAAGDSRSTLEVVRLSGVGDLGAVAGLIARAAPSIRRWAHGRVPGHVRHEANTEDVVQDAMLHALNNLARVRQRTVAGLQAYLRTSVVNRIRDLIRGTKRHGIPIELDETVPGATPSPLESAILREGMARFVAALEQLTPRDRLVLIWRLKLGYDVEEIAVKLGKSKAAAGMCVSRAMTRLAAALKLESES
jgi:RNA polymerase sigma-70 factor, ECF subfamily